MNTHRDNTIDLHSLGEHLYHIISASSPTYFISLRYNLRDKNNVFDSLRKEELYDIDKVRGTHHHINNLLREAFGDLMTFWFIERDKDFIDKEGKQLRNKYSSHLILSTIQDDKIEEPTRTLKRVMREGTIPIECRAYTDIEDKKIDCLDAVLRKAEWTGTTYDDAVDIEYISNLWGLLVEHPDPAKDYKTGYLLKQINKKIDIDELIDKKNSSY